MGDENSLQGRTQAHKHQLDASTGGFLETGLTGMTNLSEGSLIMGNAATIQTELSAGNNLDVLTMGLVSPSWVPAPSGAATVLVDSVTLGASNNTITSTFAPVNQSDVSQFFCVLNAEKDTAGGQINLTCNSLVTATYDYGMMQQNTAAPTGTFATGRNSWDILFNNLGDKIFTKVDFLCNAYSDNIQGVATTVSQTDTAITRLYNTTAAQTSISEIEFTVSAGQWYAGSRLEVFRINN